MAAYSSYSVDTLKTMLIEKWNAVEQTSREHMAPLLYYLHKKLRAPGRKGEGFEDWVKENLGIAIRTANRWVTWYAEQIGKPKPPRKRRHKATSLGHVAETPDKPEQDKRDDVPTDEPKTAPEERHAVPIDIMLTDAQDFEFAAAVIVVGDRISQIIFDAVTARAELMAHESQPTWRQQSADHSAQVHV